MDAKIKRVYVPMTETGFYILFCLQDEMHGYSITQKVREMTGGGLKKTEHFPACIEKILEKK